MVRKFVFLAAFLSFVSVPLTGHAATLQVNCDQPTSKLPTINAALKLLSGVVGDLGPNTIQVSGACNENIAISGTANLTLTAQNGASITDASGGTKAVIDVERSTNFALNGFVVRGGGGVFNSAILCIWSSTCYFSSNNVQSPNHVAVNVAFGSFLSLNQDVLEQSLLGLFVQSSKVEMVTAALRNNTAFGAYILDNSFVAATFSTTIDHNSSGGMLIVDHSTVNISYGVTITANGDDGLNVQSGSEVVFGGPPFSTVSGNNGNGIGLGDGSYANFIAGPTTALSGNQRQPDVACYGHFSYEIAAANASGTTNCQ